LGRVARDVRRLQSQRDLRQRQEQLMNRAARQALEVSKLENVEGSKNLALQQARQRAIDHYAHIQDRIGNLEVRRAAITARGNQIESQRIRTQASLLNMKGKEMTLDANRLKIEQQIARTEATMAGLRPGATSATRGVAREQALLRRAQAQTAIERQELARDQANARLRSMRRTGASPEAIGFQERRRDIIGRQVGEARRAEAIASRNVGLLNEQLKDLGRTLNIQRASLARNTESTLELSRSKSDLSRKISLLDDSLASLRARTNAVTTAEMQLNRELDQARIKLQQVTAAEEEASAALQIQQRELAQTNRLLAEHNALISAQKWEQFATGARAISHTGRVMQMFGMVGTAAFGLAAVSAAHFNQEATLVATQTGDAFTSTASDIARNADSIEKSVIRIMQTIPANQQDLTDTLYNIYSSMNVTFGRGTQLLELFGQAWEAGGMRGSIEDVSNALITLGNNWSDQVKTMDDWKNLVSDTMATVRFGRMTIDQYTTTMNQLAPAFHNAGQSIDTMNVAIAFMTRQMPSQRMAATGLARLMTVLARVASVRPDLGLADAQGNLKQLNEIIDILIQKFPKLLTSGVFRTNFFKDIAGQQGTEQARRAFTGLVEGVQNYRRIHRDMRRDQNEFNRSLAAMGATSGVRWAQFVAQLKAFVLVIGRAALPALLVFGRQLQRVMTFFGDHPDLTRAIGYFGAFAAVLTMLVGTVAVVLGSFAGMILSAKYLGAQLGSTEKSAGLLARILGRGGLATVASEAGFAMTSLLGILVAIPVAFLAIRAITGSTIETIKIMIDILVLYKAATLAAAASNGVLMGSMVAGRMAMFSFSSIVSGLGAMTAAQAVGVGILGYALSTLIRQIPGWDAMFKSLGSAIYDAFHPGGDNLEIGQQLDQGNTLRTINAMAANIKRLQDLHVDPRAMRMSIKTLFPMLDEHELEAFFNIARKKVREGFGELQRTTDADFRPGSRGAPTRGDVTNAQEMVGGKYIDTAFRRRMRFVDNFRKQVEKSPSFRGWQRYYAMLEDLNKHSTNAQQQAWQQMSENVATISDTTALRLFATAERLRKAFEKAPSTQAWNAYWKAQEAFTSKATQSQQQMAQEMSQQTPTITNVAYIAQRRALEKIRRSLEKHHSQSVGAWINYYDQLRALDAQATDSQRQAADSMFSQLDSGLKKSTDAVKQHQQDLKNSARQTVQDITSNLSSQFSSFQQANQGAFGTLFQGPFVTGARTQNRLQWGGQLTGRDLLTDLQSQVSRFNQWNRVLRRLERRGIPFELLQQIQAAGPDSIEQARALLSLPQPEFRQYTRVFRRGQQLVNQAATRDMQAQLAHWRTYGKSIMLAILRGMDENDARFKSYFRNLAIQLFPQIAGRAGAGIRGAGSPTRAAGRTPNVRLVPQTVNHNTNNYNYIAGVGGMDYNTWMQKNKIRLRNRK
jgi:hypothetical protein